MLMKTIITLMITASPRNHSVVLPDSSLVFLQPASVQTVNCVKQSALPLTRSPHSSATTIVAPVPATAPADATRVRSLCSSCAAAVAGSVSGAGQPLKEPFLTNAPGRNPRGRIQPQDLEDSASGFGGFNPQDWEPRSILKPRAAGAGRRQGRCRPPRGRPRGGPQ